MRDIRELINILKSLDDESLRSLLWGNFLFDDRTICDRVTVGASWIFLFVFGSKADRFFLLAPPDVRFGVVVVWVVAEPVVVDRVVAVESVVVDWAVVSVIPWFLL